MTDEFLNILSTDTFRYIGKSTDMIDCGDNFTVCNDTEIISKRGIRIPIADSNVFNRDNFVRIVSDEFYRLKDGDVYQCIRTANGFNNGELILINMSNGTRATTMHNGEVYVFTNQRISKCDFVKISSKHEVTSTVQTWLSDISFMQQAVLLSAIRGCDVCPHDHPIKQIIKFYRRSILVTAFEKKVFNDYFTAGGGKFTGPSVGSGLEKLSNLESESLLTKGHIVRNYDYDVANALRDFARVINTFVKRIEELPMHFTMHFLHAINILRFKHPENFVREWWGIIYNDITNELHLNPESEEEMDKRLDDIPDL